MPCVISLTQKTFAAVAKNSIDPLHPSWLHGFIIHIYPVQCDGILHPIKCQVELKHLSGILTGPVFSPFWSRI